MDRLIVLSLLGWLTWSTLKGQETETADPLDWDTSGSDEITRVHIDPREVAILESLSPALAVPYQRVRADLQAWLLVRSTTLPGDITVRAFSGRRTQAEQLALYRDGRSQRDGSPGRESRHQLGLAVDTVVEVDGSPVWEKDHPVAGQVYKKLGSLGFEHGLEWGGGWSYLEGGDVYHLEVPDALRA